MPPTSRPQRSVRRECSRRDLATATAMLVWLTCTGRADPVPPPGPGSPASPPRVAVRRAIESSAGVDVEAVIDSKKAERWSESCLIRHACPVLAAILPRCKDGDATGAVRLSDVLASAPKHPVQWNRIRGRLGVSSMEHTLKGCRDESGRHVCCNRATGPVILWDGDVSLSLDGLWCSGDDSRGCCNAPAFGQEVLAAGTLIHDDGKTRPHATGWHLANPVLCNIKS